MRMVDSVVSKLKSKQFERLFQFARRIEDLMYTITPEEIPFQLGLSKMDLRKVVKSSLSGVDKHISAMYKKLQKNLTSEELLPSLWDICVKVLSRRKTYLHGLYAIWIMNELHYSSCLFWTSDGPMDGKLI